MSETFEYLICALGGEDEPHSDPERRDTFPVDHPLQSGAWGWWAPWVDLAFMAGRLLRTVPEPPRSSRREEKPEEILNLVAYREWLIEHAPTARFVGKIQGVGPDWLKIEFTSHTDYVAHKMRWVGDESADCN